MNQKIINDLVPGIRTELSKLGASWEEFLPQAGQEEYRSRRHAWEADRLNQARRGRSPNRREDSRDRRRPRSRAHGRDKRHRRR